MGHCKNIHASIVLKNSPRAVFLLHKTLGLQKCYFCLELLAGLVSYWLDSLTNLVTDWVKEWILIQVCSFLSELVNYRNWCVCVVKDLLTVRFEWVLRHCVSFVLLDRVAQPKGHTGHSTPLSFLRLFVVLMVTLIWALSSLSPSLPVLVKMCNRFVPWNECLLRPFDTLSGNCAPILHFKSLLY